MNETEQERVTRWLLDALVGEMSGTQRHKVRERLLGSIHWMEDEGMASVAMTYRGMLALLDEHLEAHAR
jgi:hypothetical protein